MFRSLSILVLLALLWAGPVQAHKLRLFASANGARVEGVVYFVGGAPARAVNVQVLDLSGEILAELVSDESGQFVYEVSAPRDVLINARSADGHAASWRVLATELAPGFAGIALPADAQDADEVPGASGTTQGAVVMPPAEAAIERALARQLRPLREQLAALEQQRRFQDVLGGLGYIAGLSGLGLWWASRRSRERRPRADVDQ